MSPTTIEVLEATGAHLRAFELPTPWSVTIHPHYTGEAHVEIQLPRRDAPELASALLAWADTLTAVTAEAWRIPDGASVHLSITGHLPSSASMRVYGDLPHTEHGLGGDLDPDTTTPLLLSTLRQHATSKEVARS
jgi:hypothetical protein